MTAFYPIKQIFVSKILLPVLVILSFSTRIMAQAPANDDCSNAINIPIPNGGFGLGNFTSVPTNLANATVQTGETYAPAIFVAGLDKKSVWYKFSIPTIRAVRVTLTQAGTAITAGDAGFAVYQTNACLPTNDSISTKLTPIVTFGNTYHPCVPSGDYLIQVSSRLAANGPITIQLEISDQTGAAYDHPNQAYAFDTVRYYAQKVDFNTECQSIEDSSELCNSFSDKNKYNKTAWLTFTTPSYFDYLVVQLSGTGASSYFPSNNNQATYRTFGYTLYKGNAVNTAIKSLQVIDGCDSLQSNGYYAGYKVYKCSDLQPATTYSIQVFIKKDFGDDIRIGVIVGGQGPTKAPKPILSGAPAPNAVGILPSTPNGIQTSVSDVWGCNSRHNSSNCGPALPDSGISYNGGKYNLSSFVTFTLDHTAAVYFNGYVTQCGTQPLIRVYKQGLTNNCTGLDTANIIGVFNNNGTIDCMQPGKYTVQISGQDYTQYYGYFTYGTAQSGSEQCLSNNLGAAFRLDMTAYTRKAANKYSMTVKGAFDSINRVGNSMKPLIENIAYPSVSDTLGCENTLRPADTTCSPANAKVIYREFIVNDSGTVDFSNLTYTYNSPWRYRLYSGDVNALVTAQNVFAFPDKVSGLVPKTECLDWQTNCTNKTACVIPGTYTFTTMGGDADVGRVDNPTFTFVRTRTIHKSPLNAQNLGSIIDTLGISGGTIKTDLDTWSCDDNAVTINGYVPCSIGGKPATKAIYRQFYLKDNALVQIQNTGYYYCYNLAYGVKTLFYGKATDGLAGLTPVGGPWSCFPYSAGSTAGCTLLTPGWYTVVSYGQGPGYDSTFRSLGLDNRYNSYVSYHDEYNITITPTCPGPKFNRPYKASIDTITKQPHLITWGNRAVSTAAYPRTDTTYILPTEHFNCVTDTPFSSHPIKSCENNANRVVYYVFKTTRQSFLQINTGGYYATLYDKDVRKDSAAFATLKPVQYCNNSAGYIQFCFFQPGTYTLVVFAKDNNICQSVTPSIYIDRIGYSRFDYAKNAYDFGVVPPDSAWHYGKTGDVNPLNSGRKPSNDFFFCTTGASNTDPADPVCNTKVDPNVYDYKPNKAVYDSAFQPNNGVARRNLWYTFVVNQPGYVKVRVEPKTDTRGYQPKFSVYQSDVDGNLPFITVVSTGQLDSTVAQGLKFIATNPNNYYYCPNLVDSLQFYRDPCTSVTNRYYILVENVNAEPYENGGTLPSTQLEVSVLIDSVRLILPKHDHYYQAGNIGSVGVGTFQGDVDNYSCATKDATDPFYYYGYNSNCQKTLWYKFDATITGNVRYRMKVNGVYKYDYYNIQLFRQVKAGDSTTTGLSIQGYSGVYDNVENASWAQCCVSPGTYYIMLTGCEQLNEYVYPEIELIEAAGDFCSRAVPAVLNGPGSVTASVLVDCHTIGTDYGEFGPQLTCPQGANTADYKSSWFRMDIGGRDTLDVTAYLVENTNAASSDIKYRLMTGDCGAMQEQSCVEDALTQNTYQCLVPGQSYYVQVLTPVTKFNQQVTGTIDLKLSAVAHADTCAPLTNCLASANFNTKFDCKNDDSVKFVNFSTYGTSITYKWDFGYQGKTSTVVSPSFFYPPLPTDKTYTIKLLVTNDGCHQKDSVTRTITVPARPYINFGKDITQCNSTAPVLLTATSWPGATYLWQNNTTEDTLRVTSTGSNDYWVKIDYKGCSSIDTIKVLISPITAKPVQNIVLCADSISVSVYRGQGETYKWNTGAVSSSIYASKPGIYWADITYLDCVYRDSFAVNDGTTARPLGNDTTFCLSDGGHVLDAASAGAVSYTWQDGSTHSSLKVTTPGQYSVTIDFGGCIVKDTVKIGGFPPPVSVVKDTSICFGQSFTLPWGPTVTLAGVYRDTLSFAGGCDSLVLRINLTIKPKPNIEKDSTICLAQSGYMLNGATSGALSYTWQDSSTSSNYTVTKPGLYWVSVNFGSCSSRDSITISGTAPAAITITDTSICAGSWLRLPWGAIATTAGTYRDTLSSSRGCDSIIRVINLAILARPHFGNDTIVSICSGTSFDLSGIYNTAGLSAGWTIGNIPVANPASVNVSGAYTLIAVNPAGCADTAITTLNISKKPSLGDDISVSNCQNASIDLPSYYNTTGLTASWTVNGATVNTPASITVPGVYRLIVSNAAGCMDTALVTVAVNSKPDIGPDKTVTTCRGNSIDLTNRFNTDGFTKAWTIGGAAVTMPAAITEAGLYQLIVANNNGCKDTAFVTVAFNPKPDLGPDKTISLCMGSSVNLALQYSTESLATNWTNGGTTVANPAIVTNPGIFQLIVITDFACADTASLTVISKANPVVTTSNPTPVCAPATADLTAAGITSGSTPGLSFTYWENETASVPYPNASNAVNGKYYIKGTDANGCSNIQPVTVIVYTLPLVTAGNDTTICDQSYVLLHGSAANLSGGAVSYLWTPPTGLLTTGATATIARPGASITYTLTITVDYGPCKLSASDEMQVNMQPPVPAFAGNDTIAVTGVAQQLGASGGVSYLWSPAAPLNNPNISNPLAVLHQDTRFIVRVTDFAGCVGTDTVFVKVYDEISYYLPNAFTPNGDGLNDIFRPIPAGIVSTEYFRIFSRYGQLVFETSKWMDGWDGTYRGKKQPIGNYVWVIKGTAINGRVIEQRGNVVLVR